MPTQKIHCGLWLASLMMISTAWPARAQTLARNPDNPRHFVYQGKPIVLITATEHYGAVLNLDFQYVPYLDELARNRLNLTRTFTFYREVEDSIPTLGFANTLAPRANREILPWKRTGPGRALDGGLKFDLNQWNEAYFARFRDFLTQAARRGVIVEVVLFCRPYDQRVWSRYGYHPDNNINGAGRGIKGLTQFWEIRDQTVFDHQKAFVRKIVKDLNGFDNVYFEILNEGYGADEDGIARLRAWQLALCDEIRRTEKDLPKKHLIAVNAHQRVEGYVYLGIGDEAYADEPRVDMINYHYMSRRNPEKNAAPVAVPEGKVGNIRAFLKSRRYLRKPIVFDENWAGILKGVPDNWTRNRMEAWETILGGGAGFDHLDWSFTPEDPTGSAKSPIADGRRLNGEKLRKQLGELATLWREAGPERMAPNDDVVSSSPTHSLAFASSRNDGRFHVIYVADSRPDNGGFRGVLGGEVKFRVAKGKYRLRIFRSSGTSQDTLIAGGGESRVAMPEFREDCVLVLDRE